MFEPQQTFSACPLLIRRAVHRIAMIVYFGSSSAIYV